MDSHNDFTSQIVLTVRFAVYHPSQSVDDYFEYYKDRGYPVLFWYRVLPVHNGLWLNGRMTVLEMAREMKVQVKIEFLRRLDNFFAAFEVSLPEYLADVIFDCLHADDQAFRNLAIGCASFQLLQYLKFPPRQGWGIVLR